MISGRVQTGLDRVAAGDALAEIALRGRVGLVLHPASVDAQLRHARFVFNALGADVRALFGPEHGYGGEAQDMIGVEHARDPFGVPIHSLYGSTLESLTPEPETLASLDTLVIDLQDVGSRYYTYVWTAVLAFEAAAAAGVHTVVLDRPNPLGGARVEGAAQRKGYCSFVGLRPVAVRHGMTIGEIVRMAQITRGIDERLLTVVPMLGWERAMRFSDTGLPWVLPSPNMPTCETAEVYPGGCLLEGTTLSEGRGLTRPFEMWGAPGLDGRAFAAKLTIDGAILRPVSFLPGFQKHRGTTCTGVQVHVTDTVAFEPYTAYLRMIATAAEMLGDAFEWRADPYEFVGDVPAIDLLTGGPEFRAAVDARETLDAVLASERAGADDFRETRRAWLIYPERG